LDAFVDGPEDLNELKRPPNSATEELEGCPARKTLRPTPEEPQPSTSSEEPVPSTFVSTTQLEAFLKSYQLLEDWFNQFKNQTTAEQARMNEKIQHIEDRNVFLFFLVNWNKA